VTAPDAEIIASAGDPVESVDGFGAVAPEGPASERPELLLGAAFLGGLLLARIVRRRAS
jgi:MYXO-CTERM domain-containing protein